MNNNIAWATPAGNVLFMNESAQSTSGGELHSIWNGSGEPIEPLFNGALDSGFDALLEVAGVDSNPGEIDRRSICIGNIVHNRSGTGIFPVFEGIAGSGTELDPFMFSFDPNPLDPGGYGPAP
jgi:hypothetical protein